MRRFTLRQRIFLSYLLLLLPLMLWVIVITSRQLFLAAEEAFLAEFDTDSLAVEEAVTAEIIELGSI